MGAATVPMGELSALPTKTKRTPRIPAEVRFWQLVDKSAGEDACWPWTGNQRWNWRGGKRNTYGTFYHNGQNTRAHRYVYVLAHGALEADKYVCHKCDNPICVNPAHLFAGTSSENAQDRSRKGRIGNITNRLTKKAVWQIHVLYAAGHSANSLAPQFGVSEKTVSSVVKGQTHRDVYEQFNGIEPKIERPHAQQEQVFRDIPGTRNRGQGKGKGTSRKPTAIVGSA